MEQNSSTSPRAPVQNPDARSPFLPLVLMALTVLLLVGFQTNQLLRERVTLAQVRTNQEAPIEEARKLRAQLDSLGRNTARLAARGNANAKAIVEQLRSEGITIKSDDASN